jgi:hypothetical protein
VLQYSVASSWQIISAKWTEKLRSLEKRQKTKVTKSWIHQWIEKSISAYNKGFSVKNSQQKSLVTFRPFLRNLQIFRPQDFLCRHFCVLRPKFLPVGNIVASTTVLWGGAKIDSSAVAAFPLTSWAYTGQKTRFGRPKKKFSVNTWCSVWRL